MTHTVYLVLQGQASVAHCSCGWQSNMLWLGLPELSAREAQSHWRLYSDNPGLWPLEETSRQG